MKHYFGDVGTQYANGCQMDLVAKLAIEFLKADLSGGAQYTDFTAPDGASTQDLEAEAVRKAAMVLALARNLISLSEAGGHIKPLPENGLLNADTRHNLERQVRAQAYQQGNAQRWAEDETPRIAQHAGQIHGFDRGVN